MNVKNALLQFGSFPIEYTATYIKCKMDIKLEKFDEASHQHYRKKEQFIVRYLSDKFQDIINKYKTMQETAISPTVQRIWICWLQGEEQAPFLVRKCIESVRKHAGNRPVVLLTENNYRDYVTFPGYIEEKIESGIISKTIFSDLLRVSLLEKFGGLWLDATVYSVRPIPDEWFDYPMFCGKGVLPTKYSYRYAHMDDWTVYFLAGMQHSLFYQFLQEFLYEYWKREKCLIDYFLTSYVSLIGREQIPLFKKQYESIPYNNVDIENFALHLNDPYTTDLIDQFLSGSTSLYKLSYKWKFYNRTPENQLTLFDYFCKYL